MRQADKVENPATSARDDFRLRCMRFVHVVGAVPRMAGNRIQQLEERDEDRSRDMTRVAFDGFEICTLCSLEILVSIRYMRWRMEVCAADLLAHWNVANTVVVYGRAFKMGSCLYFVSKCELVSYLVRYLVGIEIVTHSLFVVFSFILSLVT